MQQESFVVMEIQVLCLENEGPRNLTYPQSFLSDSSTTDMNLAQKCFNLKQIKQNFNIMLL